MFTIWWLHSVLHIALESHLIDLHHNILLVSLISSCAHNTVLPGLQCGNDSLGWRGVIPTGNPANAAKLGSATSWSDG